MSKLKLDLFALKSLSSLLLLLFYYHISLKSIVTEIQFKN